MPFVVSSSELTPSLSSTASRPVSRFTGKRIHFIGIGGCGMSGLAQMLVDNGAAVTGSELKPNPQTFKLAQRGVRISRDQLGNLLSKQTDLVVRTAAISDSNLEYQAALAYGLPIIKYAKLLGMVMQERLGIAVAGTHGKSTTSAMIAYALGCAGKDPSFVIGGTVPQLGGGSHSGGGQSFVAEACEFDHSFHNLHPTIALITNIEEDHLDCYKDLDEIVESFSTFARLVPASGQLIANAMDANCRRAVVDVTAPIQWCAVENNPLGAAARCHYCDLAWVSRVTGIEAGCYQAEVLHQGKIVGRLQLSIPGVHNLMNATMALAACHAAGADVLRAIDGLNAFTGVDRRMTLVGQYHGATVVDDYAHHPTEIRATLEALRLRYRPTRLICIFQPHQHSRTRFLLEDFADSFALADQTIVPDIYFVRDSESERQKVSSGDLVQRIIARGGQARHIAGFPDIVEYLRKEAHDGDLIVTLGAGNVCDIAHDLVG